MPKLTPWFDGDLYPARPGNYDRLYPAGAVFRCHFDGIGWRVPSEFSGSEPISLKQSLPWRGLASEPKGKK